ncbi:MAG: hypothetical protein HY063_11025 [Bacteroidetes bacterium]|nr:hypothetical protein [Bacteroidota bacterium]
MKKITILTGTIGLLVFSQKAEAQKTATGSSDNQNSIWSASSIYFQDPFSAIDFFDRYYNTDPTSPRTYNRDSSHCVAAEGHSTRGSLSSLIFVLVNTAKKGTVPVYDYDMDNDGPSSKKIPLKEIKEYGIHRDSVFQINPQTGEGEMMLKADTLPMKMFKALKVNQEWYWNAKTNKLEVIITDAAPLHWKLDDIGELRALKAMCYFKFVERAIFTNPNHKVFSQDIVWAGRISQSLMINDKDFFKEHNEELTGMKLAPANLAECVQGDWYCNRSYEGQTMLLKTMFIPEGEKLSFWIFKAAYIGALQVYADKDGAPDFTKKLSVEQIKQCCVKNIEAIMDGNATVVHDTIRVEDASALRVNQDWYFNKATFRLESKITSVALMMDRTNEYGERKGYEILFWVKF